MKDFFFATGPVEPIAYFFLGFLLATFFGVLLMPKFRRTAARVAEQRRQATVQLLTRVRAKKNEQSADFARSIRSFEAIVEELKNTLARQRAELGRSGDSINRLRIERSALKMEIVALRGQALPSSEAPSLQPSASKPGPMFLPLEPDEREQLSELARNSSQEIKSGPQESNPVFDLRSVLKSRGG